MTRRVEVSVNGRPAFDQYMTGTGQVIKVHARARCRGEWCVIHRPMPGPWENWPTCWDDLGKRMYRQCEHGLMHMAPEEDLWGEASVCLQPCGCPCKPNHPDAGVIDGEWFEYRELGS